MQSIPRIIISAGDPAGIGPELVIRLVQESWPVEIIVVGDPQLFQTRSQEMNYPLKLKIIDFENPSILHQPSELNIVPVKIKEKSEAGKLNSANSHYVIQCLDLATEHCLNGNCDALVTGPINKSVIKAANIPFTGHTEFLAEKCQVSKTMMLFVVDDLKVALTTIHIPLKEVSKTITQQNLSESILLLHHELKTKFKLEKPKIAVCGLNPHAGENGYIGREEIDVIIPVLNHLKSELALTGPWSADTVFIANHSNKADAILAMYHDQALPVIKYLGFNKAVNMTLGLPIIRTSVDHGTALDIAPYFKADPGSLFSAMRLAIELVKNK